MAADVSALEALEADATAPPEGVLVPLVTDDGSVDILVPPSTNWFEGALEAMTGGQWSRWAELALEGESLTLWQATRKRYRDIDAFLVAWQKRAGQDVGKSSASEGSSRSTRRR